MEIERPFSEADWLNTPQPVRPYVEMLERSIMYLTAALDELKGRTDKLEERVNRNSQNSSKPPSSDAPFKKPKNAKKKSKKKRGGQKGHPGHRQQLLAPNKVFDVKPTRCDLGLLRAAEKKMYPILLVFRPGCCVAPSRDGPIFPTRSALHPGRNPAQSRDEFFFPVLIDLVQAYFKEQQPDLSWIG
jgi:hypothetical protein